MDKVKSVFKTNILYCIGRINNKYRPTVNNEYHLIVDIVPINLEHSLYRAAINASYKFAPDSYKICIGEYDSPYSCDITGFSCRITKNEYDNCSYHMDSEYLLCGKITIPKLVLTKMKKYINQT